MTSPAETSVITQRNQVLTPLAGSGNNAYWYQITTAITNPDFSVTLSSAAAFQYSQSASGPWLDVPIGAALELSMNAPVMNFYINITGTLELVTG